MKKVFLFAALAALTATAASAQTPANHRPAATPATATAAQHTAPANSTITTTPAPRARRVGNPLGGNSRVAPAPAANQQLQQAATPASAADHIN